MKKTQIDVFEAMIEMMMEQQGLVAVKDFRQHILPKLRLSPMANQELTDQEYDAAVSQIRKEFPCFLAWLIRSGGKIP